MCSWPLPLTWHWIPSLCWPDSQACPKPVLSLAQPWYWRSMEPNLTSEFCCAPELWECPSSSQLALPPPYLRAALTDSDFPCIPCPHNPHNLDPVSRVSWNRHSIWQWKQGSTLKFPSLGIMPSVINLPLPVLNVFHKWMKWYQAQGRNGNEGRGEGTSKQSSVSSAFAHGRNLDISPTPMFT